MKDCSTYRRGQVWYISDDVITRGSIQSSSRPFVVVSNDICNMYSSVIHLAPITSKSKNKQPTHVIFKNPEGDKNTILLEQVTVKSIPAINRKAKYMFTLSDAIMSEVDTALQIQFGLPQVSLETITIDIDLLENMDTSSMLEVAATSESTEDTKEVSSQIDKFNARLQKYNDINNATKEPEEVSINRTKSGRIRWTNELKGYFLYESTIKSEDAMMDKYGFSRQTYRTTLSKIRKSAKEYNEHDVAN